MYFFAAVFLFHLSNAAMLPQLGELLARGDSKAAAPFMSACIIVTQLAIAGWRHGSVNEPIAKAGGRSCSWVSESCRCVECFMKIPALLIGIQFLDGIANCIFVVVAVLVVCDRTEGTGRFNLAAGAMATVQGLGAASSATFGGFLNQRSGFNLSFVGLAVVGALAAPLLWWKVPETRKLGPLMGQAPISLPELLPEKATE